MRTVLSSHLRAANYRGDIKISTSIANGTITVCSPHWINRLRNHRFVFWACIILQLWIVTWPVIWFLERRYEVVRSVWRSSREVASPSGRRMVYACGKDEAAVADFWGPAVRQGAWCRTQESTILNQRDAELLLGAGRRNMQRQTLEEPLDRSLMMANSVAGGMFGRVRRTGGTQRFDLGMGNWSFSMALGGNH